MRRGEIVALAGGIQAFVRAPMCLLDWHGGKREFAAEQRRECSKSSSADAIRGLWVLCLGPCAQEKGAATRVRDQRKRSKKSLDWPKGDKDSLLLSYIVGAQRSAACVGGGTRAPSRQSWTREAGVCDCADKAALMKGARAREDAGWRSDAASTSAEGREGI